MDATTGRTIVTIAAKGWLHHPTWSPDGKLIATANAATGGRLWDAETGELRTSFEGHTDVVTSIAFSPDGALVVTTSFDRSARVWDTSNGSLLAILGNHEHWVTSAVFSADGQWLVTDVARAERMRIWDLRRETRSPAQVEDLVRCRPRCGWSTVARCRPPIDPSRCAGVR